MKLEILNEGSNKVSIKDISTPQDLLKYMKSNISYWQHDSGKDDRIESPDELLDSKKGDCYDQVEFEKCMFKKMGIKYGCLHMFEYKTWPNVKNSHSILYYYDKEKIYWFENAWGKNQGIHGPYSSIDKLKDDLCKKWDFSTGCDKLVIHPLTNVKPGMTHNEYVMATTQQYSPDKEPTDLYINESSNKVSINSKYYERDDFAINIDKWTPYNNNFLYITGVSGSGKTTLAIDMQKNYNARRIELDYVVAYYLERIDADKKLSVKKRLAQDCPGAEEFFTPDRDKKYHIKEWRDHKPITDDFLQWFMPTHINDGNLYVMNGAQIPYMFDEEYLADKPLIIKHSGSAVMKSGLRRLRRELQDKKNIPDITKCLYRNIKLMSGKGYRKGMQTMSDLANSVSSLNESDTNNFDLATAVKDGGFYVDGVWNSLVEKDGKYYRDRGETFVFKGKKVFCQIRDDGTIKLPGGSTERGMTNIAAAEKEIHEEMRATITNMKDTGVVYTVEQKPSEWMYTLPIKYNGAITTIYTAKYKGKYTGKIDKDDYDDFYLKGKWHDIEEIYNYCNKYQKEVLSRFMKPIEEAILNIASETTRSIAMRAIYENQLGSVLNDDVIPITPCYTPDEMEALGVFNDDPSLNMYGKSTSYGAKQWFQRYKVTGDVGDGYFDTIVSLHPGTDMSDEARQTCLEYGWNPDLTLEEAKMTQSNVLKYLKEQYNSVDVIDITEADIDEDVKFKADMINLYNIVKDKVIDLRAGDQNDPITIGAEYIQFVGEEPKLNDEDAKIGHVYHDKLHLVEPLITILNNHIAGKDSRYKLMIVGTELKAAFYDIRIVANTAVSGTEMIQTSDIIAESTDRIKSIDDFINKYK